MAKKQVVELPKGMSTLQYCMFCLYIYRNKNIGVRKPCYLLYFWLACLHAFCVLCRCGPRPTVIKPIMQQSTQQMVLNHKISCSSIAICLERKKSHSLSWLWFSMKNLSLNLTKYIFTFITKCLALTASTMILCLITSVHVLVVSSYTA